MVVCCSFSYFLFFLSLKKLSFTKTKLSSQKNNPVNKYIKFSKKLISYPLIRKDMFEKIKKVKQLNGFKLKKYFVVFPFKVNVWYTVFYRIDFDVRDYIRSHSKSVRERAFFIWYASRYFCVV